MARTKKKSIHYVDNAKFLEAMKEWKEQCKDAEEAGDEKPRISNYIGECFLKIANGLSYRPNFINYSYRQEMISDGIENCLQYVHNFDPDLMLPDEDVYKPKKKKPIERKEGLENFMDKDNEDSNNN